MNSAPAREVGDHRLGARIVVPRFAVALATGKVDIEQMQLVVAGSDRAVGADDIGAVGDLA